jgi:hypothetical protein
MADYTLRDGREITFDLYALTYGEYLAFFDPEQPASEEKEVIARVCGLTEEEMSALPFAEVRLLTKAFFERAREPIEDPNS